MELHTQDPGIQLVKKLASSGLIPVAVAFAVIAAFCFTTIRIGHVSGEEVGVLLDRFTGEVTIIEQSGAKIYNGIRHQFSVLDKTLQTLDMTDNTGRGDRKGKDDIKIKTKDGSDVYVNVKVQYRIIPEAADLVAATSGLGDAFKQKWARDYSRTIIRNYLGELTTEEFYDSSKRDAKLVLAQNSMNDRLNRFGINIDSIVIPQRPRFYADYEAMIKKKKLADQAVLEEQSKALAAKQKQNTMLVKENNRKNVEVEQFSGEMEQKIIQIKADAERGRKAADAYFQKVTINAKANLYELEKSAEGILAKRTAEANGIRELNNALSAPGGRTMVKLEYARKLANMTFSGKPFIINGETERFEHLQGAASTQRKK